MIWIQSLSQIYVFYERPWPQACCDYQTFDDLWKPGDLESDPSITPPPGSYQPVRGFGKVWREQSEVRERLGWALASEQSFTTAYQRDWRTCSGGCSHAGNLFLQAGDNILLLDDGYGLWRYFP